ncbi:MAG: DUF4276 family protein [Nannocystis sp.]|nr:DUF4276 family protein [Nannocystis sp.]
MTLLRIQPIVEGHGEVEAVPILLRRIYGELLATYDVDILPPLRHPKTRLVRDGELQRFAGVAANKLRARRPTAHSVVLLLLDGDGDLPCVLGPQLLERAKAGAGEISAMAVIAHLEFETWFVAAASSLATYLDLRGAPAPTAPETHRARKKWIEDRFRGVKYSETLDQPKLTAKMDLRACRASSPSFDKLCRDLARELSLARG